MLANAVGEVTRSVWCRTQRLRGAEVRSAS